MPTRKDSPAEIRIGHCGPSSGPPQSDGQLGGPGHGRPGAEHVEHRRHAVGPGDADREGGQAC
ncbi:hypothetical protein [Streptomyces sviceus]|uniref:hypothetical protein n=1 Tax=Streptomyces sviceus TaxID=285530 RepID=UPI003D9DD471